MDVLGKTVLWLVGLLIVLVCGISAILGSAVAVFGVSLAFVGLVAERIGATLQRAWEYVRFRLFDDLKGRVNRWETRSLEKSLRKFDRLTDESYRLEREGKYVRAWIMRRRAASSF
jgi:hypothetical protein